MAWPPRETESPRLADTGGTALRCWSHQSNTPSDLSEVLRRHSGANRSRLVRSWQNPRPDMWSQSPVAHKRPRLAPYPGRQSGEQSNRGWVDSFGMMTSGSAPFSPAAVFPSFLGKLSSLTIPEKEKECKFLPLAGRAKLRKHELLCKSNDLASFLLNFGILILLAIYK